jgi:hypothetical protein
MDSAAAVIWATVPLTVETSANIWTAGLAARAWVVAVLNSTSYCCRLVVCDSPWMLTMSPAVAAAPAMLARMYQCTMVSPGRRGVTAPGT